MEYSGIGKSLLSHAIPVIISMTVVAVCNITDRLYIGESAGSAAFAGLALTLPFMVLFSSIGSLIGIGTAARITSILNTRNYDEVGKFLGNALILTLAVSGLLILVYEGMGKELIIAFGGRADTIPHACRYLSIVIPGILFTNFTLNFCHCIRISGNSRKSTRILVTGILGNLILTPTLVYGFNMGIEGAAWATVISMFGCSLSVLCHFLNPVNPVRFQQKYLKTDFRVMYKIILSGMAPFFMNMTICTVSIIMNNFLVVYGKSPAIGAYGIISSYSILIMMVLAGLSQGMQTMIRQNPGSFKIRLILRYTLGISIIITGICFMAGEFLTRQLVRIFSLDPTLNTLAKSGLHITFCTLPILGIQLVTANFFQSISKAKQALFMNLSRQFIFLIPSVSLFSHLWGVTGIWWAIPFSDFMATSVSVIFLWLEKRRIVANTQNRLI